MSKEQDSIQAAEIANFEAEDKELTPQPEQLLKDFKKLDAEVKFSSKELQNQLKIAQQSMSNWIEKSQVISEVLDERLSVLGRETMVLSTLPRKVGEHLEQLVPRIAAQVQKILLADYEIALVGCNAQIDLLNGKLQLMTQEMKVTHRRYLKGQQISYIMMTSIMVITVFASSCLTYFYTRQLPSRISIDSKGAINVKDSQVSIWKAKKDSALIKNKR